MANHTDPGDPKKFIMVTFISFVIVFVFVMLMMLWRGSAEYSNGERHYQTVVKEP